MKWALTVLCLALAGCQQRNAAHQPAANETKPELALLTSLPILFGETLTLDAPANPLLAALQGRFRVEAVDGPERLKGGGLLLAIQPQALTAERLVALDAWVRAGGRMVLLADPWLSWESQRPLGDTLRPPFTFPDTGLLAHWGLSLSAEQSRSEPHSYRLGGFGPVTSSSMGRLTRVSGTCVVSDDAAVARCRLGKGQVLVVSDADFAMSPPPENQATVVRLTDSLAH